MRLDLPILLTLTLLIVDCGGLGCQAGDEEHFSINLTLHESDIVAILDDLNKDSREQISCKDACEYVYMRDRGWYVSAISGCEYTINAEGSTDPDAEAGEILCDGKGFQYLCE